MNATARIFYEQKLTIKFLTAKGNAFEDLFAEIMRLAYPGGDFSSVTPWGKMGDRKHDGYLTSRRQIFQVYAPHKMTQDKACAKISEDFAGACDYWSDYFDRWTFVSNSDSVGGPEIERLLLSLAAGPPKRILDRMGPAELRLKVFGLCPADVSKLLGPPVTSAPVKYQDVQTLLSRIAAQTPEDHGDIPIVPPGKINANGFNANSKALLNSGLPGIPTVERFLADYYDAELGVRVAENLKAEYADLKAQHHNPDEILSLLFAFVAGHELSSEMATMAVLRHFFEACDIFEAPTSSPTNL